MLTDKELKAALKLADESAVMIAELLDKLKNVAS